jgi:hypothetical protein
VLNRRAGCHGAVDQIAIQSDRRGASAEVSLDDHFVTLKSIAVSATAPKPITTSSSQISSLLSFQVKVGIVVQADITAGLREDVEV